MITLVLGGVRSGKSEVAEGLVGAGTATYLATAVVGDDADLAARVERHRQRRPAAWTTVEEPVDLAGRLSATPGPVLVDALGAWVANAPGFAPDVDALIGALAGRAAEDDVVVVSEEVGLGVHPPTEVGRRFADALGSLNRRVAEVADRCLLVVAGKVVELPHYSPVGPPAPTPREPGAHVPGPAAGWLGALAGFRSALAFLTPLGGPAPPVPAALAWFPVVGMALGFVLGLVWVLVDEPLGPLAGAAVVVAADLALTGALHFDGLVDTADGLGGHMSRPRRLAVMAEPGIGAFGLAAGAMALIARVAALATVASVDGPHPLLLAALWCAARTSMALVALGLPYARPGGGLATAFVTGAGRGTPAAVAALGSFLAFGLAGADDPAALAGVASAGMAVALVVVVALR
ncbi:MAG: bifunctional adenosylcobinamide kinase/adenosylcobinamide-phosphate guanylyltransferase, partial [Acidimicrobiia bacterium]